MLRTDPRCIPPGTPGRAKGEDGSGEAPVDAPGLGATRIGGSAVREEGPIGAEKAERDMAAIMMMSIRTMP